MNLHKHMPCFFPATFHQSQCLADVSYIIRNNNNSKNMIRNYTNYTLPITYSEPPTCIEPSVVRKKHVPDFDNN